MYAVHGNIDYKSRAGQAPIIRTFNYQTPNGSSAIATHTTKVRDELSYPDVGTQKRSFSGVSPSKDPPQPSMTRREAALSRSQVSRAGSIPKFLAIGRACLSISVA